MPSKRKTSRKTIEYSPNDLFEIALSTPREELEIELRGHCAMPWLDFLLNPRRLRGSDFLMRWSQGVWSEKRLIQAVNDTGSHLAMPYGPSGTAPDDDPKAFEMYFERLERASTAGQKRPDLLVFRRSDEGVVLDTIRALGGVEELPFTQEDDPRVQALLDRALIAVECENSLWRAKQMPDYGSRLTPQRWLAGNLGLKKAAVVPTVIVKEEDRGPLREWQKANKLPIHVWHVFYDFAYGISLDLVEKLITRGRIAATVQVFQAPGGATTKKTIYKVYYHHAYVLGESLEEPALVASHITDKNGHILPYVKFEGGRLALNAEALELLNQQCPRRTK